MTGVNAWMAALQLARHLGIHPKTAFTLLHRMRHALSTEAQGCLVGGPGKEVEVDGCYIGGHVRKTNWKHNRRDRRLARNQSPKRRVVVAARERGGRIVVTVVRKEKDGVPFLAQRIRRATTIHADEAASWNDLEATHQVLRITHEECYSDGVACTNQAESLFSRLRKLERGQHHHISGPYLYRYAVEVAFREDHRRYPAKELVKLMLTLLLTSRPDPVIRGYYQRRRRSLLSGRR